MKELSIVIPCYNEGGSIPILLEKCASIATDDIEILLVDNGSSDGTFDQINQLNTSKNIRAYRVEINTGYGNGILEGLAQCKGEILAWTHADLQTDPADVTKAFLKYKDQLKSKECVVKGNRRKRNLLDTFFTFGMSIYSTWKLKTSLFDINAQPKMFHQDFLRQFDNPPKDFSLDLYILYFFKQKNVTIKSFPVYFNKRLYGEAKGGGTLKGKVKLIKRTFKYINELSSKVKA